MTSADVQPDVEVLQADETRYILNHYEVQNGQEEESQDVVYADATYKTIYIQNGQYLIPADSQTIIVQGEEEDEQYFLKDEDGMLQFEDDSPTVVEPDIVQYYDEETGQIYCYTDADEGETQLVTVADLNSQSDSLFLDERQLQLQAKTSEDEPVQIEAQTIKRIKLENQYINVVGINENKGEEVALELQCTADDFNDLVGQKTQPKYQYAILKDGKLHLQTINSVIAGATQDGVEGVGDGQLMAQLAAFQQSIVMDNVDLENITGKNLITGQVVTLDGYLDRLRKRIESSEGELLKSAARRKPNRRPQNEQKDSKAFVNKKFVVGKTSNGKRLVGKIVKIEKRDANGKRNERKESRCDRRSQNQLTADRGDEVLEVDHILISSGENKDSSKIKNQEAPSQEAIKLTTMQSSDPAVEIIETTQASAPSSNVHPQIIIKKHLMPRESFKQKISNILMGLMEMDSVQQQLRDKNIIIKLVEKQYDYRKDIYNKMVSFVCGHMESVDEQDTSGGMQKTWQFVLDNKEVERVVGGVKKEDDRQENEECEQMKHSSENETGKSAEEGQDGSTEALELNLVEMYQNSKLPTVCLSLLITIDKNGRKSTRVSINKKTPSYCRICDKTFKTALQLQKHVALWHTTAETGPVICEKCGKRFANGVMLHRHNRMHTIYKFECSTCGRQFTRHSNLIRHLDIHKKASDGGAHKCELCGCVYNFASSLTRHIVQKHISKGEARTDVEETGPLTDSC